MRSNTDFGQIMIISNIVESFYVEDTQLQLLKKQ